MLRQQSKSARCPGPEVQRPSSKQGARESLRSTDPSMSALLPIIYTKKSRSAAHSFFSHKLPRCFLEVRGDILIWPLAWSCLGFFSPSGVRGLILGWSGWADARVGLCLIVRVSSHAFRSIATFSKLGLCVADSYMLS